MCFSARTIAVTVVTAAGLFVVPAASAMSHRDPSIKTGGSSKLVDPDEAIERMAERQAGSGPGRFRAYSDSSMEARDAVRSQPAHDLILRPLR